MSPAPHADRDHSEAPTTVNPDAVVRQIDSLITERDELRAKVEKCKSAAKTLGEIIDKQCQMVLDATGRHDLIGEDGDGDWGAVWDWLSGLRPRAEAAEAERDRARSLAATLEARLAQVEAALTKSAHMLNKQQTVWTLAELQDDLAAALKGDA
jgi:hypothetical protein